MTKHIIVGAAPLKLETVVEWSIEASNGCVRVYARDPVADTTKIIFRIKSDGTYVRVCSAQVPGVSTDSLGRIKRADDA